MMGSVRRKGSGRPAGRQNRLQRRSLFQTRSGPMSEVDASLWLLDSKLSVLANKDSFVVFAEQNRRNPKQFGSNFSAPAGV